MLDQIRSVLSASLIPHNSYLFQGLFTAKDKFINNIFHYVVSLICLNMRINKQSLVTSPKSFGVQKHISASHSIKPISGADLSAILTRFTKSSIEAGNEKVLIKLKNETRLGKSERVMLGRLLVKNYPSFHVYLPDKMSVKLDFLTGKHIAAPPFFLYVHNADKGNELIVGNTAELSTKNTIKIFYFREDLFIR